VARMQISEAEVRRLRTGIQAIAAELAAEYGRNQGDYYGEQFADEYLEYGHDLMALLVGDDE
jgi:hypothetical protein